MNCPNASGAEDRATAGTVSTRVDIAIRGVRLAAPVRRTGGAGPSDDGHVVLDGLATALPLRSDSPYLVREGRLVREDPLGSLLEVTDLGIEVEPVQRPRFYDLATADGTPYEKIAKLHGRDVLATTVVQTCSRYAPENRCRFCAIESSLESGSTIAVKTPAMLAEVAEAAVRLDGVKHVVMTTGTSTAPDRGARHLARCVRAVTEAVPGLPVQVQCEPPADLATLTELKDAGASSIGIHVESLDEAVRRRWMPGKSTVPLAEYRAAWIEAVRVFGRNQVSTYLLVGLGEDPDELVAGAEDLVELGVYPFVVPFRPLAGTLAVDVDGAEAPGAAVLEDVSRRVAKALRAGGMRGADQMAGCAACGACSVLQNLNG
ncbi:radical SAM protein (TIGR04043 family) [Kineococcus radiotolerans]|uniref:Radical SAM protein (TIGR04043 family) n=1 Tax=Kineococcus radiotolerans TaxID=131568 RepID=A0A7W4TJ89_KINRA|nr:MSMEG_0568 family radical SAM protein [Kineococcus radiotolerans]MBB2899336.1 radical SAM protein (TIGR04043 family) [Kineococcus radiotolerans]